MEERLAPNSVRQYAAKLKAVLNLYNEEVELPKDYNKILSVKNVRSTNVWLSDEELERIISTFTISNRCFYRVPT
jgi:integrase